MEDGSRYSGVIKTPLTYAQNQFGIRVNFHTCKKNSGLLFSLIIIHQELKK